VAPSRMFRREMVMGSSSDVGGLSMKRLKMMAKPQRAATAAR
jgi:hypothetical protein